VSANNGNVRDALREWVRGKAKSENEIQITDETLLIGEGLITSVDVLELFMLIEELGGIEIDATELQPHMLESIDKICQTFFEQI
jgi:acyl carrier protein